MTRAEYEGIQERVQRLVGGQLSPDRQGPLPIDYDELLGLIDVFPYNKKVESSTWLPGVLRRVIERQRERCQGRAYIYTRRMQRKTRYFVSAVLEGKVRAELHSENGPVFCAFRDDGKGIDPPPANEFWYPTIVLDKNMPSMVVNVTPDEP